MQVEICTHLRWGWSLISQTQLDWWRLFDLAYCNLKKTCPKCAAIFNNLMQSHGSSSHVMIKKGRVSLTRQRTKGDWLNGLCAFITEIYVRLITRCVLCAENYKHKHLKTQDFLCLVRPHPLPLNHILSKRLSLFKNNVSHWCLHEQTMGKCIYRLNALKTYAFRQPLYKYQY